MTQVSHQPMGRGFYTIMAAQFFSSLADNALLVAAIELLKASQAPTWHVAALAPMFALFYVIAITILVMHFTGFLARHSLDWLVLVLAAAVFPAVIYL